MLLLFLISGTLFSEQVAISQPDKRTHACFNGKNPICEDLLILKPGFGPGEALRLSNVFHKVSRRYRLNPRLMVAIAFQESSLTLEAVRQVRGISLEENSSNDLITVGSDFCMMQINAGNISRLGLDAKKLLTDAEYCIEAGARILRDFQKKYGDLERNWWSRYNSCTPTYREMYEKLVSAHWKKLFPVRESTTCADNPRPDMNASDL